MKKICFVHIPKCGGTSIRQSLLYSGFYTGQPGHRTDTQHKKLDSHCRFDIYIAQVRNPYERIISSYNFMHRQYHKYDGLVKKEIYERHIHYELNDWIKLLVDDGEEYFHAADPIKDGMNHPRYCCKPQNWWIRLEETKTFKIEEQTIWGFFNDCDMDVPKFHSRKSHPVATNPVLKTRNDLNKESITIINLRYKEDFRRFNYEQI